MKLRRSCVGAGVFALVLGVAHGPEFAGAEGAPQSAEELFASAGEAFRAGELQKAAELYARAFDSKPSHDIAANLGVVLVQLGRHREGAERLEYARTHMPVNEDPKKRGKLERLLSDTQAKLGQLEISTNVDGAMIKVGDRQIGTTPLASNVYVEPGTVVVVAEKDGYEQGVQRIAAKAGAHQSIVLELRLEETKPETGAEPKPIWPAVVLGGVGFAGIGVGIAGFVLSSNAGTDAESLRSEYLASGVDCSAGCVDVDSALSEEDNFAAMGGAGLVVGGLAAIGAVAYIVFSSGESADTVGSKLWIQPSFGRSSNGLELHGSF